MKTPVRIPLVVVICLLAAACAHAPAPRPLANGFGAEGGVAEPYADGKRHLAEGNYEPTNSRLAPGGGEMVADAAVRLLNDLRGAK